MDCCSVNGLDKVFNKSLAQRELRRYLKRGLGRRARAIADFLKAQGVAGVSVLEVGSGVGAIHLELMRAGAARAAGYDASSSYVEAATSLAERLGLKESVEYHVGDFVKLAPSAHDADFVVLDRVVCCYPDMRALLTAAALRTRRYCALTYPRRTWWVRLSIGASNLLMAAFRREFRAFVHRPEEVSAVLASQGLGGVFQARSGFLGMWEVVVCQRARETAAC